MCQCIFLIWKTCFPLLFFQINCRTNEKLILSTDKHLARIEVFNSLAVTAPQIEIDRLRYDRRHNMTGNFWYIRKIY